jgi:Tfp pilus assembly protein PilF
VNEDPDTLLRLALARTQNEDLPGAAACLRQLVEVDDRHELAIGMLAAICAQQGEPGLTASLFTRVLELNPANPLARFQLGLLQFQQGDNESSVATLQPSFDDPDDFLAHFIAALALTQLERPAQARELLDVAAARMPHDHPLASSLHEVLLPS